VYARRVSRPSRRLTIKCTFPRGSPSSPTNPAATSSAGGTLSSFLVTSRTGRIYPPFWTATASSAANWSPMSCNIAHMVTTGSQRFATEASTADHSSRSVGTTFSLFVYCRGCIADHSTGTGSVINPTVNFEDLCVRLAVPLAMRKLRRYCNFLKRASARDLRQLFLVSPVP